MKKRNRYRQGKQRTATSLTWLLLLHQAPHTIHSSALTTPLVVNTNKHLELEECLCSWPAAHS